MTIVRAARADDIVAVLEMNEGAVPNVNDIPRSQMEWFLTNASYFRVVDLDDRVAGFLIALGRGLRYDSVNYRWFHDRYPAFMYVDRIVTASWARRRGVAHALYTDLFAHTRAMAPVITCEVNLRPANEGSMAFHRGFGFTEVGTQDTEGGAKTVSLMVSELGDQ